VLLEALVLLLTPHWRRRLLLVVGGGDGGGLGLLPRRRRLLAQPPPLQLLCDVVVHRGLRMWQKMEYIDPILRGAINTQYYSNT